MQTSSAQAAVCNAACTQLPPCMQPNTLRLDNNSYVSQVLVTGHTVCTDRTGNLCQGFPCPTWKPFVQCVADLCQEVVPLHEEGHQQVAGAKVHSSLGQPIPSLHCSLVCCLVYLLPCIPKIREVLLVCCLSICCTSAHMISFCTICINLPSLCIVLVTVGKYAATRQRRCH